MKNPRSYRVTLQVLHPCLLAGEITPFFPFKVNYERSVGISRISRNGVGLGGAYAQTNISFLISDDVINCDEIEVTEFLENVMFELPLETIKSLVSSNGKCFFLIGIYSNSNFTCDFNGDFLSNLNKYGIGLKLEFWGGD